MLVSSNQALGMGRSDEAISDAGDYLRRNPYGPEAAEAFYLQGRGYEQKISDNPTEMSGNLSQARDCYQLALGRSPSDALEGNIRASLSNVSFFQDDFAGAIDQASQAMRLTDSAGVKSFLLYRIGVSQQRLGEWTSADETFNQVIQKYPGSSLAEAAREHLGQRQFYVQLATYSRPEDAEKGLMHLAGTGVIVTRRTDSHGRTVADTGPFETYQEAKKAKVQLGSAFPQALIVP
jgi:tetratricopeptide (TPR) repeat protein